MALAQMSRDARKRLHTAFNRGDVPYVHNDLVYIGRGLPPLKLRSKNGDVTTAGSAYGELLEARGRRSPEEHLGLFARDARVVQQGRQEFAETRQGRRRLLRTFQPGTGQHLYTKHGHEFFEEERNFVVHMPVKVYWKRGDPAKNEWSEGYTHTASGERETVPLSLDQMQELGLHMRFPKLATRGAIPQR